MKVGVGQAQRVVAAPALSARRILVLAQHGLAKPESQSLLADAARTVKQKTRRQASRLERSPDAVG
jgi:hypothetical protein